MIYDSIELSIGHFKHPFNHLSMLIKFDSSEGWKVISYFFNKFRFEHKSTAGRTRSLVSLVCGFLLFDLII